MPRPTIAHVLHRLDRAGAEVLVAELARKLGDQYRFVFLCLDGLGPLAEELADEGFTTIDLRRRPGVDTRLVRRVARLIRTEKVDLLHAHQYSPFFYAAAGRSLSGLRGSPPLLFTEHGRHRGDRRRTRRVWANRALLRSGDHVTAVAGWVRQALIDHEGLAPWRVQVVPNGIDPARFTSCDFALGRAALGLPEAAKVILHVGRFAPVKDHATALRAFSLVALQQPDAHLALVGDGPLRPQIERDIDHLGLAGRVHLLGLRSDVPRLLAGANVVQLSSTSEGMPVTVLEAMAAGKPVAATAVGGTLELVEHGTTGLLSPARQPAALASHLLRLLREPDLARAMGQAGRARLLAEFTQQRMHASYQQLYQRQIAASARPRQPRRAQSAA
ncbi:MAG: glycosyltransferase [Phycisphaeraceae bacterium]